MSLGYHYSFYWHRPCYHKLINLALFLLITSFHPTTISAEDDYEHQIKEFAQTQEGIKQLLMIGVLSNDIEYINKSIELGVDLDGTTSMGETALFIASSLAIQI